MTQILARCISSAVESSNFLGPEQQGFRQERCCKDNVFLLNSMLSDQENKQLVSHLMFLDLKETYDQVDRPTLYRKLRTQQRRRCNEQKSGSFNLLTKEIRVIGR